MSCYRLAFLVLSLSLAASQCVEAQSTVPAPAYKTNPKYLSAVSEGKRLTHERQLLFAEEAYRKANKIAAGQDPALLDDLINLQFALGEYKDAAATAAQLESISTTPAAKVGAEIARGRALFSQAGDKNKPELLQAAEASFKAAILNSPKNGTAHYFDGLVLARLGKLEEAGREFKECLTCISPKDPSYLRAQHFAENPALSTAKFAPPFEVVALDGSRFNLDAMGGRVVLIDFWATWCGPCNEELPHLKKIAKEFAGQPLVILSISWDDDETKWKDFIKKNEMTWVQYRDVGHNLSRNFNVDAIPHYFTIDSDGVLTAEMLGSGSNVEGKLKKLVARANARAVPPATIATSGN